MIATKLCVCVNSSYIRDIHIECFHKIIRSYAAGHTCKLTGRIEKVDLD